MGVCGTLRAGQCAAAAVCGAKGARVVKMRGEVFRRQDDKSSWLSLLIILNTSDNYSNLSLCYANDQNIIRPADVLQPSSIRRYTQVDDTYIYNIHTYLCTLHLVWQKMSTNDFLTDTNMWQFLSLDRWYKNKFSEPICIKYVCFYILY